MELDFPQLDFQLAKWFANGSSGPWREPRVLPLRACQDGAPESRIISRQELTQARAAVNHAGDRLAFNLGEIALRPTNRDSHTESYLLGNSQQLAKLAFHKHMEGCEGCAGVNPFCQHHLCALDTG
jgi:hypothetical protein